MKRSTRSHEYQPGKRRTTKIIGVFRKKQTRKSGNCGEEFSGVYNRSYNGQTTTRV